MLAARFIPKAAVMDSGAIALLAAKPAPDAGYGGRAAVEEFRAIGTAVAPSH